MKIKFIRLRDFRNISFAEISLEADSVWIYGKNAQGKTNLLEAIGLLTALRSFRASKPSAMISKDKESSDILVCLEHETLGETEIQITLAQKKKVFLDGNELKSLGEFIGKFPALAMSSEDIRLIRGTPEIRRRDIDMFISGVDSNYFKSLKSAWPLRQSRFLNFATNGWKRSPKGLARYILSLPDKALNPLK